MQLPKRSVASKRTVKEEIIDTENTSILIMHASAIYLLDSSADCWNELRISLPISQMDTFGTAWVNGKIYIFGGKTEIYIFGGKYKMNFYQHCYKLESDGKWMELAFLNEKRGFISNSSVVYFEEIWIIGGNSGNQYLRSVEKYNISQNKWIQMPEMNQEKCYAAAAVFKNKIIVTGGLDTRNSVELFDLMLKKWILFCHLPVDAYCHCMTISDSILTIYGGLSSIDKSVWEMDIEDSQKKWTKKQDLKYPRYNFGIAKLLNGIMAIGGGRTDTTEIFDGNNWKEGPSLPQKISGFAYAAIPRSFEKYLLTKFL